MLSAGSTVAELDGASLLVWVPPLLPTVTPGATCALDAVAPDEVEVSDILSLPAGAGVLSVFDSVLVVAVGVFVPSLGVLDSELAVLDDDDSVDVAVVSAAAQP